VVPHDVLYHIIAAQGNSLPAKKVVLALADHLLDVHVVKVGVGIGQPQAHHPCLIHRSRLQRRSANAERPQGFAETLGVLTTAPTAANCWPWWMPCTPGPSTTPNEKRSRHCVWESWPWQNKKRRRQQWFDKGGGACCIARTQGKAGEDSRGPSKPLSVRISGEFAMTGQQALYGKHPTSRTHSLLNTCSLWPVTRFRCQSSPLLCM
jgi:hypothetical protein